ncbi:MAG: hypothetical protein QUS33_12505 [Dehalococcoidia bacterium]|nr:hypothetical protein [Dehalococcoidia bacterium]
MCGEERVFVNKITPQNKKPVAVDETIPLEGDIFPGDPGSDEAI